MKTIRTCALLALAAFVSLVNVSAQDRGNRGNFDPEQMRERMMERVREQLDVKDDAEWKLISERVSRVTEARRDLGAGGNMAMLARRRGGDGDQGGDRRRGGPGGPGGFFGGAPSAEAEALQKALDAKASNDEVKAKLAKYREARKEKREKLEKAQDDLRKVLSSRQEAAAVVLGLLD